MHYFSAGLSTDDVMFHHTSVYAAASCHGKEEPFEPAAEIESQTIANLLPDEDDLFSEVFNALEFSIDAKGGDSTDGFDLFSSVGGMELEGDDGSSVGNRDFDFVRAVSQTNKLGPSWTGDSKQCLMKKCHELEKDGASLSKSTDDILSSQSTFDGFRNESLKELHSASQNVLSDRSSCILNSFPYSLDESSAGDHFGLPIPSHLLDLVKVSRKYMSSSVPHSFPDCENNLNYFTPHELRRKAAHIAGSIATERKNVGRISVAGPNRRAMESQGVIGPFGNATCPVHGHLWSNCYPFHYNSLGHKESGFSAYCSGSLGDMGPVSSFLWYPSARGSPTCSHSGQNCQRASHDVMNSTPQIAHSLGSPREIWRNFSHRRNQGSFTHMNKKEFELDIERILRGEDV